MLWIFSVVLFLISMKSANALASNSNSNKMRILCLHGKMQSASTFSNKIAGARRKLERVYDLHFLNGPIVLSQDENSEESYAWWNRDASTGKHVDVHKAFDFIKQQTTGREYDAILGFSQGGTLATTLALSGTVPGVRAVVTAGAPYVDEVFQVARDLANDMDTVSSGADDTFQKGLKIPKFHFAGERDELVPVDSTRALGEHGGNSMLDVHDQGHLFPTRAMRVNQLLEFLEKSLAVTQVEL